MQHLQPFAEQLVLERYDPRYLLRKLGHSRRISKNCWYCCLRPCCRSCRNCAAANSSRPGGAAAGRLIREFDTASNRLTLAIILASSIIGSALIMQTQMPPLFMGYPLFGMLGFVLSAVLGFGLVIALLRAGGF